MRRIEGVANYTALRMFAGGLDDANGDARRARNEDRSLRSERVHVGEQLDLEVRPLRPFSWTRSTPSSASLNLVVNERRFFEAPEDSPNCSRAGQALSIYSRRFSSAFGAGSVAITSRPCARNNAPQLAPMTPVPKIALQRIGLSADICVYPSL